MGLDNYAARHPEGGLTAEDKKAFEDTGIDLCGGMHSNGIISFRWTKTVCCRLSSGR